jgi:hypothetical protein
LHGFFYAQVFVGLNLPERRRVLLRTARAGISQVSSDESRLSLNRSRAVKLPWSMSVEVSVSGTPAQLRVVAACEAACVRWAFLLPYIAVGLVLLTRDPFRVLDAQLWAEDGPIWIYDDYTRGLGALLLPHTGYLQTYPRLAGFCSVFLPLTWAPTLFALIGFVTQLVPAWLLLSRRGRLLVPAWQARLPLVLFYIGVPNSFETYVNMTNAQWHVAIILVMILLMQVPARRWVRFVEYGFIFIGGVSGPFSFILAPIAWWRTWREGALRAPRAVQAGLLTVTAMIQAFYVMTSAGAARHLEPLGASFSGFARIVVGQVFMAGIIGAGHMTRIEESGLWQHPIVPDVLLVAGCAVMLAAFMKGETAYRTFVIFAAAVLASALISPVISNTQPQWDALEVPGAGSRYYLLPILAWFAGMLVLTGDRLKLVRWGARVLLLTCALGSWTDWTYARQPETGFVAAAKTFDNAPPGTNVILREAPDPAVWLFSLTKR